MSLSKTVLTFEKREIVVPQKPKHQFCSCISTKHFCPINSEFRAVASITHNQCNRLLAGGKRINELHKIIDPFETNYEKKE